jgi:hypothetical protein
MTQNEAACGAFRSSHLQRSLTTPSVKFAPQARPILSHLQRSLTTPSVKFAPQAPPILSHLPRTKI